MSVALVAPSIALTAVTGIPVWVCILCLGLVVTLYTTRGGIKADIYTDCMQFVVMVGGLFLMLGILLSHFNWDLGTVWQQASANRSELTRLPHTTMFDFRFDFKTEATFWSLLFFLGIYNIGTYGTDQVVAQRYFTMGGLKAVVRTVILSGFLSVLITLSLVSLGLVLTAYMHDNPELAAQIKGRNKLVPYFISNHLPVGIRGLLIASLFAATMATVNSGINSTSAVAMMDLYKRYSTRAQALDERRSLRLARYFSLAIGVLVMTAALLIRNRDANVVQTVVQYASKFIGPITGMFFLGILTKRGNVAGAFLGAAAGLAVSFAIELEAVKEHIHWMWTLPLSSLTTFIVGYVVSIVTPRWQLARPQKEMNVAARERIATVGAVEVGM
jgi:SSS family transporter